MQNLLVDSLNKIVVHVSNQNITIQDLNGNDGSINTKIQILFSTQTHHVPNR